MAAGTRGWPRKNRDLALWAFALGALWFALPQFGKTVFCRAYCANYIYARLTVYDTGAPDLTYQWQYATDGVTFTNMAGARSNQVTAVNSGYYRCVLTSACGNVTSNVAAVGYVYCGY